MLQSIFWIVLINFRFQLNPESRNEDVAVIGQNTRHSKDKEINDNWKAKQYRALEASFDCTQLTLALISTHFLWFLIRSSSKYFW